MPPDEPSVPPANPTNGGSDGSGSTPASGSGRSRGRRSGLRGSGDLSPATFAKLSKHLASLDDKSAAGGKDGTTEAVLPGSGPAVGPADVPAGAPVGDDPWYVEAPASASRGAAAGRSASRTTSPPANGGLPPRPIGSIGEGGRGGAGGGSSRPRRPSRSHGASRKNLFRRRSRGRKILIWSLLGVGALIIVGALILGDAYYKTYKVYGTLKQVPALVRSARADLQRGQIPRSDQLEKASGYVGVAQQQIGDAGFAFNLVRSLPLLGRPIQAITLATDAASKESDAATIVQSLIVTILGPGGGTGNTASPVFQNGVIDVAKLQSVTPDLERVVADLQAADRSVRAIPSIPFVHNLGELKAQVLTESSQAVALSERALAAFRLLPSFLGADGPKTYYLAMQNNDDQRGTGGAVLSYALVRINHGELTLVDAGPIDQIDLRKGGFDVPVPKAAAWYLDSTGVVKRLANGANYSPDFPAAAQAWRAMLQKTTLETKVDGVIALDPYAVAAALVDQKPITVIGDGGASHQISSANVVQFVMHDQYLLDKRTQRLVPGLLIKGAFEAIASPKHLFGLMHALSSSLVGKHIQVWSADPKIQGLVSGLGWDGSIRNPAGGDYLNLAYEKRIGNKVDYFAHESVTYDVTALDSGAIRSQYDLGLSLDTMPAGLPESIVGQALPYGADVAMFNLYVPGAARFVSVSPAGDFPVDAISVPNPRANNPAGHVTPKGFVQHTEGPFRVLTQTILAWPGRQGSLRFRYGVPGIIKDTPQGKTYTLTVQHQPLVNPQNLVVRLHLPAGAEFVSAGPGWIMNDATHTVIFRGEVTGDFTTAVVFK